MRIYIELLFRPLCSYFTMLYFIIIVNVFAVPLRSPSHFGRCRTSLSLHLLYSTSKLAIYLPICAIYHGLFGYS